MSVTESSNTNHTQAETKAPVRWTGLGHWNFYFLAKLFLYWGGYLQFNVFYNLLFACALVFPLGVGWANRIRHIVAIPFAIALLYHDTWYPPLDRLLAQPEVLGFSFWYVLELLERFINWNLIGAGFIGLVVYLYLYQWLRLSTLTVLLLVGIGLNQYVTLPSWFTQQATATLAQAQRGLSSPAPGDQTNRGLSPEIVPNSGTSASMAKPTDEILNQSLESFYQKEQTRTVAFPQKLEGAPFDILFISICSLSWSDLEEVDLTMHPLFKNVDIMFDNFNSATSYSGPAILRLLRANCGQTPHAELYEEGASACYLFQTLDALGFKTEAALNHDGKFQGFLDEVKTNGNLPDPYIPVDKRPSLTGFDGSPIWNDFNTLDSWWKTREDDNAQRVALLYNTITLHDGNREATADGGGRTAPFRPRAEKLFDEIGAFFKEIEQSGRRVMVVFISEHGAALKADRMQIAGMREVPTFDITHVPVGVKLIGTQDKSPVETVHVTAQISFLAISDLISRVVSENIFEQPHIDWQTLIKDLPTTAPVNENEGTIVMRYQDTPFIRMGGRTWIEYPE